MKPSDALRLHRSAIREVVSLHGASNPRVFGSVLNGVDTEDSDLDLLIDAMPGTTLFDIGLISDTLCQLLGVRVDVLTPECLPKKRRATVLAVALPV